MLARIDKLEAAMAQRIDQAVEESVARLEERLLRAMERQQHLRPRSDETLHSASRPSLSAPRPSLDAMPLDVPYAAWFDTDRSPAMPGPGGVTRGDITVEPPTPTSSSSPTSGPPSHAYKMVTAEDPADASAAPQAQDSAPAPAMVTMKQLGSSAGTAPPVAVPPVRSPASTAEPHKGPRPATLPGRAAPSPPPHVTVPATARLPPSAAGSGTPASPDSAAVTARRALSMTFVAVNGSTSSTSAEGPCLQLRLPRAADADFPRTAVPSASTASTSVRAPSPRTQPAAQTSPRRSPVASVPLVPVRRPPTPVMPPAAPRGRASVPVSHLRFRRTTK